MLPLGLPRRLPLGQRLGDVALALEGTPPHTNATVIHEPRRPPHGLFLSIQLLGLGCHLEIWNADWACDKTVIFGSGLSWRQRPIILFQCSRLYPTGNTELWFELWGGWYWTWLPRKPAPRSTQPAGSP